MFTAKTLRLSISLAAVLTLVLTSSTLHAQKAKKDQQGKATLPNAPAVFWREPRDIASRDLFLGPGGEEMKPDLTNVTFVSEDTQGYSVKWHVRDGAGRKWAVKLGNEARTETAAVRLV